MRGPNEVDFWRGLALVSIFINHIPGFYFERLTHRNLGLSDSAELFVFLAGWSMRRLANEAERDHGLGRLILRLCARAVTLYAAQILITMLAVGLIAAAAFLLDNELLLDWNNASPIFRDPVPTHIGLVLLTHQLGFFDILPLYVTLMLGSPILAIVHHLQPRLVLPLSLLLYAATLAFGLNLPTWPVEGTWYFAPTAWQLVFVLGFVLAGSATTGRFAGRRRTALRVVGGLIVAAGAFAVLNDYSPDPGRLPSPQLFFMFDKSFVTPARIIHFLGLVALFGGTFRWIAPAVPPAARFFTMLGRNSLNVFCVGSLLSISGQIARFVLGHGRWVDLGILLIGFSILGFTAWLSELRGRLQAREARSPPGPSPA